MSRAVTACDQCGQSDDHPKVMIANPNAIEVVTKHHDCLSVSEDRMLRDSAQERDSGPKVSAIIDACKKGAKGDKLLAKIESGELPQAEGLYAKEGA